MSANDTYLQNLSPTDQMMLSRFGQGGETAVPEGFSGGPYDIPYINPRDKKYASKTRAAMSRAAWEDYQARFQPVEAELLDMVQNPEAMLEERLGAIRIGTDRAFANSAAALERQEGRYGVAADPQQHYARAVDQQRAQTTAQINAENNTRAHITDRNMAVLGGGTGTRQAIQEV
ncbi:MAG: hypothetical protein CME59_22680 [Halioglobus sp.]|nr:hypothetical protein [Halioglobus sp.]